MGLLGPMDILAGAAGFGLMEGKGLLEGYWERGLRREEMAQEKALAEAAQAAKERLLRESRTSKERSIKELKEERHKERKEGREERLINYILQNRANQMAMVMQAIKSMNQPRPMPGMGGGVLNVARSGY